MKNRIAGLMTGILCTSLIFGYTGVAASPVCAADETAAVEAQAEENTFVTADGVLSVDLPSEEWKEITDPANWVVLGNGEDKITIDHYANGETLPAVIVADEKYPNVYEAAVSTKNEVFLITGYAVKEENVEDVFDAVMSARILKYDTKQAVKKEAAPALTFNGNTKTIYDGAGTAITVREATDGYWYDNAGTKYLEVGDGSYFVIYGSDGEGFSIYPPTQEEFTGASVTVYSADGNAIVLREKTDWTWVDDNGNVYTHEEGMLFVGPGGEKFTANGSIFDPSMGTAEDNTEYDDSDYAEPSFEEDGGEYTEEYTDTEDYAE